MFNIGNSLALRKRKVNKILKNYEGFYQKILGIDNEVVEELVIEDLTLLRKKEFTTDLKKISILFDSLFSSFDAECQNKLYSIYSDRLPKYSSFNMVEGIENVINYNTLDYADGIEVIISMYIKNIKAIAKIKRFIKFQQNNKSIKSTVYSRKLLQLRKLEVKELRIKISKYLEKTTRLLEAENVFIDMNMNINSKTIKHRIDKQKIIRTLIANGVIKKEKPFKVAVINIPENLDREARDLGLILSR